VRCLAIIIPEKIPSALPKGVQRAFKGLQTLPDEYLVYYEPLITPGQPDFIIISPDFGLMIVEIRNWYPGHIMEVTEAEILVQDESVYREMHPRIHASQFLASLSFGHIKNPRYSDILYKDNSTTGFRFPTGILILFPNCTISQLKRHRTGNLLPLFGTECTICREMLKELETWEQEDLIPFLRSYLHSSGQDVHLSGDQISRIRALIHPHIGIEIPDRQGNTKVKTGPPRTLKILDPAQERRLYEIPHGHTIINGQPGSFTTAIMISRIQYLAARHSGYLALILCLSKELQFFLQKTFDGRTGIVVATFEEWAEQSGVPGIAPDMTEPGDEFGLRIYQYIIRRREKIPLFDTIVINEANGFFPSWFQAVRMALKNPDQGDLCIIADKKKKFKGLTGVRWKDIGINIRGHITVRDQQIDQTPENTREILNLSRLFRLPAIEEGEEESGTLIQSGSTYLRSGLKPLMIWNSSHQNQADYVMYLVQRILGSIKSVKYLSGIKPEDIAILYPYVEGRDVRLIKNLVENLSRYFPVQWVSENPETCHRIHQPGIKIHDSHSINRLHYRAVLVILAENFERFFTEPDLFLYQNLFYNTLTCPRDFLSIQYTTPTDIIRKILKSGYADEYYVR
jgi:hypothetical protein